MLEGESETNKIGIYVFFPIVVGLFLSIFFKGFGLLWGSVGTAFVEFLFFVWNRL